MPNKENIKKHEFKKGQSGNPKGRPKGSKNRSTLAKKWLEVSEMKNNILSGDLEKLSNEDQITLAQIKKAIEDGDVQSYKALMDSAYGSLVKQNDLNITVEKANLPDWMFDDDEES